ncbi:MAG: hypothetical protein INR68_16695 [Methylobacterium mesophilicum]|nr:hypothetical protein [Methylobacterium mesophilicum]
MARRVSTTAYVEVDLSDFDDDDVLAYASTLSGYSDDADTFSELAHAIAAGKTDDAFIALSMIANAHGPSAANAVEIGRRRVR